MRKPFAPIFTLSLLLGFLLALHAPTAAQATNPVKLFKGTILDAKTGKPVDGGKVYAYSGSSQEAATTSRINPKTGAFQMILGPSITYRIHVESPRFYNTDFTITTPTGSNYEEIVKNFNIEPIPVGFTLFSGRLFDPGSAQVKLTPDSQKLLDLLKNKPSLLFSLTITPDIVASGAASKPAKPAKPSKKKKGSTEAVQEVAPASAPANDLGSLGQQREEALKTLLRQHKISLTRVRFTIGSSVTVAPKKALPDNVVVKVSGIDAEEHDEEDE